MAAISVEVFCEELSLIGEYISHSSDMFIDEDELGVKVELFSMLKLF